MRTSYDKINSMIIIQLDHGVDAFSVKISEILELIEKYPDAKYYEILVNGELQMEGEL